MPMAETKVWTLEELHSLPDDGNRYELLHGELFVTPAPTFGHETIIARLHRILDRFVETHGLGLVYSGNPVIHHAGSELIPDLLVRQPGPRGMKWEAAPVPILVVEVLSPATRRRDREFKKPFYEAEVRVPEYWIVDGERRSITVVRADGTEFVTTDRLTWTPHGVNASLEIALVVSSLNSGTFFL